MKSQPTVASEFAYCEQLVNSLKNRHRVAAERAVIYLTDRDTGGNYVFSPYTLAADAVVKVRVTFSHPSSPTPYAQLQYSMFDAGGVNYAEHTESSASEYETQWTMVFHNTNLVEITFGIAYGVKSSAPGTLSIATI